MKRAILVSMACLLMVYGCKQDLILRYDEFGKMTPVLKPGDKVTWDGATPSWQGQSPCKDDKTTTCEIKGKPHGYLYSYDCEDNKCDPEILVEDSPILRGKALAAAAGNPASVRLICKDHKSMIVDTPKTVHYGQTVHWAIVGDYSDPSNSMSVTFEMADDQRNLCMNYDHPIDRMYPDCKVNNTPITVYYHAKVADCDASELMSGSIIVMP